MTLSDNPIGAFYLYLLEPEIRFLEAAVEHLIPTDELGPGAREGDGGQLLSLEVVELQQGDFGAVRPDDEVAAQPRGIIEDLRQGAGKVGKAYVFIVAAGQACGGRPGHVNTGRADTGA